MRKKPIILSLNFVNVTAILKSLHHLKDYHSLIQNAILLSFKTLSFPHSKHHHSLIQNFRILSFIYEAQVKA